MRNGAKGNKPELDRFWEKVNKTDTCWLWTATKVAGYGQFRPDGENILAHRYSYTIHKGEIPTGLFVLHSCDNRACVNPDHLSTGTHVQNMHDMLAKGRQNNQVKTHCKYGHEFTEDNTLYNNRGSRYCKECTVEYQAKWYQQQKLNKLKDGNTK